MLNVDSNTTNVSSPSEVRPPGTPASAKATHTSAIVTNPSNYEVLATNNAAAASSALASSLLASSDDCPIAHTEVVTDSSSNTNAQAVPATVAMPTQTVDILAKSNRKGESSRVATSSHINTDNSVGDDAGTAGSNNPDNVSSVNSDMAPDRMGPYGILDDDDSSNSVHASVNSHPFAVLPNNPVLDFTSTVLSHDRAGTWSQKDTPKIWNCGNNIGSSSSATTTTPWEPAKVNHNFNYVSANVTLESVSSTSATSSYTQVNFLSGQHLFLSVSPFLLNTALVISPIA